MNYRDALLRMSKIQAKSNERAKEIERLEAENEQLRRMVSKLFNRRNDEREYDE